MKLDLPRVFLKSIFCGLFLLGVVLGCSPVHAQSYTNYKNAGKKTLKMYEKGKAALKAQAIEDAQRYFLQTNKEDPTFIDSYIKMGDLYIDLNNYPAAIQSYEKAIDLNPDYLSRLHYALGYMYYQLDHYDKAISYLEKHLTVVKNEQRRINTENLLAHAKFALVAINNPVPFEPKRLSNAINTEFAEYLPSFTANGKQLVYTARRQGQEDLFFSEKINGQWETGQAILGVNTNDNEGAQTMSSDGRMIIFTACGRKDGMGSCDLYVSYKKEDYWTRPMNMGRTINSKGWDSQPSLSANGNFLFFASTRAGGQGKSDIYVAYYQGNGQWGEPQNLGAGINTSGDEKGPFFHADGRTLYFASSGHPGMGSLDLFKSNLMGDGVWSDPVNLGYPINTNGEEVTLIVSLDGKSAYFSSNRSNPSQAATDIFEFELYEAARPNPVTYLEATVVDAKTKEPLIADVELFDPNSEAVFYTNETDLEGKFMVSLAAGNQYGLNVEKEGYLFHSESFDLKNSQSINDPYQLYIELQAITPVALVEEQFEPAPITLKNIFFKTASAALLPSSTKELNKLYQLLEDNPSMKIRIDGHTDDVGDEEDNLTLSHNRAKAVFDFLIEKGVSEDRLAFRGFGETMPIASNDTAEGRQKNRRTTFLVTE